MVPTNIIGLLRRRLDMFAIQWNVKHAAEVQMQEVQVQASSFASAVMGEAKRMQRKRTEAPSEEVVAPMAA